MTHVQISNDTDMGVTTANTNHYRYSVNKTTADTAVIIPLFYCSYKYDNIANIV